MKKTKTQNGDAQKKQSSHNVRGASPEVGRESMVGKICEVECGPMPNVMVALPNTGGALCSTPQGLADAHYYRCRAVTLPRRETR